MKRIRRLVFSLMIFILLFGFTGCIPQQQSKTEQFTGGLVDLITGPMDKLEEEKQPEYADNLSGELRELINTRSHEMSTTIEINDLGGLDNMGFEIGRGSRMEVDSAYDVNTGDGMMEVNVVNLADVQLALHNEQIAFDISSPFLQQMVVVDYNSDLDFNNEILIAERLEDLMNALNVSGQSGTDVFTDLQTDLQTLLDRYAGVVGDSLTDDQITSDTETMEILGRDTKVQVLSLTMDERDLEEILGAVLDYAKDDDALIDVVMKYMKEIYQLMGGYEPTPEEYQDIEESLPERLSGAADNLEFLAQDWSNMDATVDIYYRYEGFLSRFIQGIPFIQSKQPVAISISFEDDYSTLNMFLKSVEDVDQRDLAMDISYEDDYSQMEGHLELLTDGQEFILSIDGDADGEASFSVDMTNTKDGSEYTLDGRVRVESSDMSVDADISGVSMVEGDTESGEFQINGSYTTNWGTTVDVEVSYSTTLTQIRSGSNYESVSDVTAIVTDGNQSISADLTIETTWDFSDEVQVRLPDFDDPNAEHYDIEELFGELSVPNFFWPGF